MNDADIFNFEDEWGFRFETIARSEGIGTKTNIVTFVDFFDILSM